MYKVMIIDNEFLIREGLKIVIDWSLYGFDIIGEAENGIEGKRLVKELNPDLIMVDIRMPGIDGIEMLEILRSEGYEGEAIMLTGYAEFEYARKAMGLDVDAYMLKPIDEEELTDNLKKIKTKLDSRQEQVEAIHEYGKAESLQRYKDLMFHGIWDNRPDHFLDADGHFHVILISINNPMEDQVYRSFRELVEQFFNRLTSAVAFMHEEKALVLCKNKAMNQLEVILGDLSKKIIVKLDEKAFISIGRQVSDPLELCHSYQDAHNLTLRRFIFRNEQLVFWDMYVKEKGQAKGLIFDTQYFYGLMEIGNLEAMDVYLSKFSYQVVRSDLSVEQIRGICVNGYVEIKEKVQYHYSNQMHLFPEKQQMLDMIYGADHLHLIIQQFSEIFSRVSSAICDEDQNSTIKRVLNYVHGHYNKNIKLEGLARLFGYNSSYLGMLFKKEVGKSFNTYLDELRIEHSKELLSSGRLKVYEVAEKVGYGSVDYFHTKFKKYVGVSPKAYK